MIETGAVDSEDILTIFRLGISSLLEDKIVTYTYHKPSGRDLPIWVSSLDTAYLMINRDVYAGYTEPMTYYNSENEVIRWSIAKSEEQCILYMRIADHPIYVSKNYIIGWGDVPDSVLYLLFAVDE